MAPGLAPQGEPTPDNFRLVEAPVPELQDGQVLVRNHFLSLDPYMRGRMNDGKSYAQPQPLDAVMIGGTVGEVVASQDRGLRGRRQGRRHGRLAAVRVVDAQPPALLRKVDTSAHSAVGLPRRGRHAGRHRLVRADEDHRAQGRRDGRRQRGQRRGGQRGRPAGQGARLPRRRPRRRARQVPRWSTNSASTPASTTGSTPT